MTKTDQQNPCVTCGACCASFRVSFYWGEGNDALEGWVPVQFTNRLNAHLRVMQGTDVTPGRCVALHGNIGEKVSCTIYPQRPSPCREFAFHGEQNQQHERCNQARSKHGLPPLTLDPSQ